MYEFHNIDCMEGMKRYPNKYFDLAIVDPPYGIRQGGEKNYTRSKKATAKEYHTFNDARAPDAAYFAELKRVSKNQIIFGANHFGNMPPSACWLVWDKMNGLNDFADAELAYTSFDSAVRIFRFRWAGMLQGDMREKETRIHPTQKPVALYEWILAKYAKAGDKILDTHVGSGSSIIAAVRGGYDIVGFEIDKVYYDSALERINRHIAQMTIWNYNE